MHNSSFYDLGWLLIYSPNIQSDFSTLKCVIALCQPSRAIRSSSRHKNYFHTVETTFPSSFLLFFKFTPTSEPRHTPGLQIDATYLLQKPPHSRRAWCAGFPLTNIKNCLKRQRKMYKSREEEKGISFIKKLRKSINCNLILLFHVLKLSAITWSWFGLQRQWTKQKKKSIDMFFDFRYGWKKWSVIKCRWRLCSDYDTLITSQSLCYTKLVQLLTLHLPFSFPFSPLSSQGAQKIVISEKEIFLYKNLMMLTEEVWTKARNTTKRKDHRII